ncbi:hypothetical protein EAI_06895 [Harpegnathos saltator]|uniref:Uncharacterized protein n=1 Tax=Harpegnathos saltator TaxID=610380 RepID=E2C9B3_HARSA|nr:hypothetical protein EAI_06895 [Harpegnathos saltator]
MGRCPTLAFSGHEGVSWKSWDEAAEHVVRSLNTGSHRALPSSSSAQRRDDFEVRERMPQTLVAPFLLESADDSAKRIVP